MPLIELPRALEDYFAFAETEPTRRGRRFSITLSYMSGEKLDRLQWWYHVTPAEEQMFDGHGLVTFRARAVERFVKHITRWLEINRQHIHGGDPLPRISAVPSVPEPCAADVQTASAEPAEPWPEKQIVNAS